MSRVVNPRIAGVDDTKDPHIWWQLLDLDNETFMAAYVAGELVVAHPDTGAPAIWRKGHREPLPDRVVDRLRAIWPAGEGLHPYPGHEILTSAAAWPADPTAARLSHRPASAIEVAPPTWLWPRWLVAGAVQLLVGRQGSGKSTFAAWVVAQLSTGRTWPDDEAPRPALRCAMLSLEEPDDRLVARLVAAGADLDSVEILGQVEDHDEDGRPYRRPWRLPGDCTALETTLVELGAAVVTIDGLGYSIRGDSHNYANVGAALSALAGVAERTGCAIVGLTHPPKGNADAVTSAIGSTAWTAVARITWVMGADPTDETGARRVVRPAPGSNYRLPDHGLGFVIGNHDETEAGFVTGLASSDVPAETITSPPLPNGGDGDDTEDACSVLADTLSGGPLWVKEARDAMTEAGFTIKQTRRAKEALKVRSVHHGKPGDAEQGWKWELPSAPRCPHNPEGAQEAQRPEVGPLGILDPGEGTLDPEEEP